jgi:glycosyltransferase involved in cell wall biosynthesis
MRIIILTWEYPPRIVGRLAEYVSTLATQLVKNNVETHIVTYHDFMTGASEEPNGAKTVRVNNPIRTHIGVLTWVLTLNQEVERAAANIYYQAGKNIDLIDAYDWHFIPAATTLKNALGVPFVYSVESLEDHRSPASNSPFNMAIRGIEWLGFYEAKKIVAKSKWMQSEIVRIYKVPKEKIEVITPSTDTWVKDILEVYSAVAGGPSGT